MTGVESRKEKRQGVLPVEPALNMPPTMVTPFRLMPASSASAWAAPRMAAVESPILDSCRAVSGWSR